MKKINNKIPFIIDLTLWILLLSATFVVCPRLWNPTETGKYFYLALAVGIAYPVAVFRFLASRSVFRITLPDVALCCFFCWIFARNAFDGLRSGAGMNLWFLMLLLPLYVVVRTSLARKHESTKGRKHEGAKARMDESDSFRAFVPSPLRALLQVIVSVTTIEAIWGFLQLHGLLTSYNGIFAISGSFFNPGPYSGFLACGAPLALYFIWKGRNRAEKILGIACIVSLAVILPATLSRAAWMAVIAGCLFLFFRLLQKNLIVDRQSKIVNRKSKIINLKSKIVNRKSILFGSIFPVALFFAGAYMLKKESADGRVFVWRTSMALVREHPVTGSGLGSFQARYCGAQADYFLTGKATEEELMNAGVPEYAFNEYLQLTVEHGIIGLLLFLVVVGTLFVGKGKSGGIAADGHGTIETGGTIGTEDDDEDDGIGVAVRGSLVAFLVFAFFSYPFSVPALMVLFVVLAAILASLSPPIPQLPRLSLGYAVLILCLGLTVYAGIRILSQYPSYRDWKSAQIDYHTKDWEKAEEQYARLYPKLNQQKHFLFEYALCLSETGRYEASNDLFFRFLYFGSDPMVYNCMGNNYKKSGDFEKAENMYYLAFHTVPNRHYPLYLLMQLYADNNEPEKAKAMAEILLEKPVKVESTAIEEMLEEAKKQLAIDN